MSRSSRPPVLAGCGWLVLLGLLCVSGSAGQAVSWQSNSTYWLPDTFYPSTIWRVNNFSFVAYQACPVDSHLIALHLRWQGLAGSPGQDEQGYTDLVLGVGSWGDGWDSLLYTADEGRRRAVWTPLPSGLQSGDEWDVQLPYDDIVLCSAGEFLSIYSEWTNLPYYGNDTVPPYLTTNPLIFVEGDCTGLSGAAPCNMTLGFGGYALSVQFVMTTTLPARSSSSSSSSSSARSTRPSLPSLSSSSSSSSSSAMSASSSSNLSTNSSSSTSFSSSHSAPLSSSSSASSASPPLSSTSSSFSPSSSSSSTARPFSSSLLYVSSSRRHSSSSSSPSSSAASSALLSSSSSASSSSSSAPPLSRTASSSSSSSPSPSSSSARSSSSSSFVPHSVPSSSLSSAATAVTGAARSSSTAAAQTVSSSTGTSASLVGPSATASCSFNGSVLDGSLLLSFAMGLPVSTLPSSFAPLYLLPALSRLLAVQQSELRCSAIAPQPPLTDNSSTAIDEPSVSYVSVVLLNELPAGLTVGAVADSLSADIRSGALQAQLGPALPVIADLYPFVEQLCSDGRIIAVQSSCEAEQESSNSGSSLSSAAAIGLAVGVGLGSLLLATAVGVAWAAHSRYTAKRQRQKQSPTARTPTTQHAYSHIRTGPHSSTLSRRSQRPHFVRSLRLPCRVTVCACVLLLVGGWTLCCVGRVRVVVRAVWLVGRLVDGPLAPPVLARRPRQRCSRRRLMASTPRGQA